MIEAIAAAIIFVVGVHVGRWSCKPAPELPLTSEQIPESTAFL